jgi:hypothetical protein
MRRRLPGGLHRQGQLGSASPNNLVHLQVTPARGLHRFSGSSEAVESGKLLIQ